MTLKHNDCTYYTKLEHDPQHNDHYKTQEKEGAEDVFGIQ